MAGYGKERKKIFKKRVLESCAAFSAIVLFFPSLSSGENSCIECHSSLGGEYIKPVMEWKESAHFRANIMCHDCHGGNPTSFDADKAMGQGFIGRPKGKEAVELCGRCHADPKRMRQYNIPTDPLAMYQTSWHGKLLYEKNDTKVATCVSCHQSHKVLFINDPDSSVHRKNVPKTCAKCHADQEYMAEYEIPTDQYEEYMKSYHASQLIDKDNLLAPNCADCHGIHGATPPGVKEIVHVCGNCHGITAQYFFESPHQKSYEEIGLPKCIDCHGEHNIQYPESEFYQARIEGSCLSCHEKGSSQIAIAKKLDEMRTRVKKAIEEAEASVKNLRENAVDTWELEEMIAYAKTDFIHMRPMAHTLSLEKISNLEEDAIVRLDAVSSRVQSKWKGFETRKKGWLIVVFCILLLAYFVHLKRRSLPNPYAEESFKKSQDETSFYP